MTNNNGKTVQLQDGRTGWIDTYDPDADMYFAGIDNTNNGDGSRYIWIDASKVEILE